MKGKLIFVVCLILMVMVISMPKTISAEVRFSTTADWMADLGNYPAGIAWGDIDNNGWLDFVTGVGIDVSKVPDKVYYNYNGHLSETAGWTSIYANYSACVQLGDLDNDGDIDMVVPGIGLINVVAPLSTVIYYNDNGFPAYPDYFTDPTINVWSMDLGDIDGDGDLDMVLPDGGIAPDSRTVKIYYNNGGVFNTSPDWQSDNKYKSVDAEFADIDMDGDLDMAVYGHSGLQVFYNQNGVLETTPSWTTYAVNDGFQLAFGDYDDDGDPDLALSGGTVSGFNVLRNDNGVLDSTPVWTCTLYISAGVSWGDVDGDGDLDLVGCGWQTNPIGIFENVDGVLSSDFVFSVNVPGWAQLAILGDYDEDMLMETSKIITSDGSIKLFTLKEIPIHEISSITVDGIPLDYSQYCYGLEGGWISLASAPPSGSEIAINYSYSIDLDLAIGSSGAYIFKNQLSTNYLPTYSFTSTDFVDENEDGFFESGETAKFYFYLNNEHAADHDVNITMTSSNPNIVFTNSSVFFSLIDGDNTTVNNLSNPIEYIIPDVEDAVFDTFFITIESSLGTYRDQFIFFNETGRAEILLIDDDGGGNSEDNYYNDLFEMNIPSHIWTTDDRGTPTGENLNQYHVVFWITGAESSDCIQPDDIGAMQDYLDDGGNLVLSGLGLADELTIENPTFLQNYLHCTYSQDQSYYLHYGLSGTLFNGLQIRLSTTTTIPGMENIQMTNGGLATLKFGNSSSSYSAVSYADDYKMLFMTFGYELILKESFGTGYASRQEVMQRILDYFPKYMCGDANNDMVINIIDIIYLINYLYKSGPAPISVWAANANGDSTINIIDITYLINYLYRGGAAPNCK
ncbi:MAG: VCBS repeat-containing protein [Candidatus Zixiibacteriota bacterium]